MKKKTSRIFTIFASIIYFLAIFYFVYNLTSEYINGPARTKQKFETSVISLKNSLVQKQIDNSNSANELKIIENSFFNTNNHDFSYNDYSYHDYSYVEVFKNGKTTYRYLPKAAVNSQEIQQDNQSKLIKSYYTSFKIEDDNYFVKANLYNLKPASIYYYARVSFLVILIVTIIAIILIVIANNKKTVEYNSTSSLEDSDDFDFDDSDSAESIEATESTEAAESIEATESIEASGAIEVTESIQTNESIDNSAIDSDPVDTSADSSTENENTTEQTENNIEEAFSIEESVPAELPINDIKPLSLENEETVQSPEGLFSPVTGLGWEQYLLTRLDSEINRAISSEFDLSLFIIKITKIERDSDTVRKVCEYLTSMFQFKDLLFEYKEECIVAIKISMNIDEAITFADNLLPEINEILKDSFAKCYIGLSSKTIRLISGERLLHEAEEALKHAEESDDSPIIGFRADAEKFRKFFENQ